MRKWLLLLALAACAGCSLSNNINNNQSTTSTVLSGQILPANPIAYIQDDQVWVASSDGANQTQLTNDTFAHFSPVWFPDQTKLLYGVSTGKYNELWTYDLTQGQFEFVLATQLVPRTISISPNNQFILYFEGETLQLFDIESNSGIRLHEGAVDATWSPDSKSIVFTTNDNRVLLQDFSIKSELVDPTVLFEGEIRKPQFVDQNTIIYEGKIDEEVTLIEFDLVTSESKAISSLRFADFGAIAIIVEPNGKRALYIRPDEVTLLSNIWLIHLSKDLPKLILTNVQTPIWTQLSDTIMYIDSTISDNGEVIPVLYTATAAGLNKTEIISNAHSVVNTASATSNEYTVQ